MGESIEYQHQSAHWPKPDRTLVRSPFGQLPGLSKRDRRKKDRTLLFEAIVVPPTQNTNINLDLRLVLYCQDSMLKNAVTILVTAMQQR
jgi:hypothetical protein